MFNYFVPGKSKAAIAPGDKLVHDELPALLSGVLADVKRVPADASVLDVKTGPNGKAGCVISPVRKYSGPPDVHYDPNYQDWEKAFAFDLLGASCQGTPGVTASEYWLGVRRGEALSPLALERLAILGGAEIADPAGHQWRVPIARAPHFGQAFGTLPQSFGFGADGEPAPRVLPSYAWLWELSGEIRDWYLAEIGPEAKQPFTWLVKSAARILAVNYRLGLAELTWLDARGTPVLTSDTVHGICQAAYGWEVLEEAKKNSTPTNPIGVPPATS